MTDKKAKKLQLKKMQNAYWRMDDALDRLCTNWEKAPNDMKDVWDAHKLLWNLIKEKEFEYELQYGLVEPVDNSN